MLLLLLILHESLSAHYLLALAVMIAGSVFVVADTLLIRHHHMHTHVITHTHDGSTHMHVICHDHEHIHVASSNEHHHTHTAQEIHQLTS
jgi:hypothetical protein